jgi:hypothetical protein
MISIKPKTKNKKCPDCGKEFEFNPHSKFKRKYCVSCSKKRKKAWDNQWKIKFEDLEDE